MRRRPYPSYRDVAAESVSKVPAHWNLAPLFAVARERHVSNSNEEELNLLSLSYGRIVPKDIDTRDGLLPESFATYQVVERNDIVLRLTDLQNDKRSLRSAIVEERGIVTSAYVAVTPINISPRYFHYLLRANDLSKVFYSLGGGLRQAMRFADLKRLPVLSPPQGEQEQIVTFLDRETARIDALIERKRRLIDLLREKRVAMITRTVSLGLDPKVQLKWSGIKWLGDMPRHWGLTRLKHVTSKIVDCPHETPTYSVDGEYIVVRTADIGSGTLFTDSAYRVDEVEYRRRVRREALRAGDIVYGREGERWGFAASVPEQPTMCLGQRMMQFRTSSKWDPRFLMWQLNALSVYRQGAVDTLGSTSPHVNVETIRNFWLAEPPLEEQRSIAAFLDERAASLDRLIVKVEGAIERLYEYRSALISEAATGQIDVREAA